ncbi:MAG: response regulator [Candidatus Omnitrophota bacterium]|nr:response regulator [Candidatus Omnitrophota bacterium]MDZ4243418.1 response regulator [Candidatus Omnitrophota bacterium]
MAWTILIVEDEEVTIKMLERRLKSEGYEIDVARDGRSAMEKAMAEPPDMMLVDIMLPDVDGADVVKHVKENPAAKNVAVLFLSSIVSDEASMEHPPSVKAGGQDYPAVAKPINFKTLLSRMREILG